MRDLKRKGPWIVVLLAALGLSAAAAQGTYLDVTVEAFQSWGFLGLGRWVEMVPSLVAVRIEHLADEDAGRVEELQTACDSGDLDQAACGLLDDVAYGIVRSFGITPNLDETYRVHLTNRTDAPLGVVLEIDGLNTNGSAPASGTSEDKKWILRPGQEATVSGWQVSEAEALAFRFEIPSLTHSPLVELRGMIRVYVYVPDPMAEDLPKGTAAGELIDQPTVVMPFASATEQPVEQFFFSYARGDVGLGFQCEETDGAGIRISEVTPGTVSDVKGLEAGDVITYINAVPINSCADLTSFLASKLPGDRVVLKVHRERRAFLLTLELQD